jgi:hypothetical protein
MAYRSLHVRVFASAKKAREAHAGEDYRNILPAVQSIIYEKVISQITIDKTISICPKVK